MIHGSSPTKTGEAYEQLPFVIDINTHTAELVGSRGIVGDRSGRQNREGLREG
jgi:hypothetical protein